MEDQQTYRKIDLVQAFNETAIKKQLQYMFVEEDIDGFIQFLRKIKDFGKQTAEKRHMILVDLAYFKSQIQKFEAQVKSAKEKEKLKQTQDAIQKAKTVGAKVTENTVAEFTTRSANYDNIEELHILALSWKDYMSDLYFMCQQTNKILDNYN